MVHKGFRFQVTLSWLIDIYLFLVRSFKEYRIGAYSDYVQERVHFLCLLHLRSSLLSCKHCKLIILCALYYWEGVVLDQPFFALTMFHLSMQLNKVSNWNHLKAVIAASDNCENFDLVTVCSFGLGLLMLVSFQCKAVRSSSHSFCDWHSPWTTPTMTSIRFNLAVVVHLRSKRPRLTLRFSFWCNATAGSW